MSKGRDRLYWRDGRGWYMDLRDLGGGQKACIPEGKRGATTDRDEASTILAAKLEELKAGPSENAAEDPTLKGYAKRHLKIKAQYRKASTVSRDERSLRIVLGYFGEDIRLSEIDVAGLTDYLAYRRQQPGSKKGTTVSAQTLLHELHALSSLYKRAIAEGKVQVNPVRQLPEKPRVERGEVVWLEIGEAARLLSMAREGDVNPHPRALPYLYPLLATLLLTGCRPEEGYGLLRRDVDLDRGLIHIRPNSYRGLKRPWNRRWVPLWPQLREILTEYLEAHERDPEGLLFPSPRGGMVSDIRGVLGNAVEAAKIEKHVTPKTCRHTYIATRIQTTDNGAPVSLYTVAREAGHRGLQQIEKTYGHLLNVRHRSPVVEYREAKVTDIREARSRRKGA